MIELSAFKYLTETNGQVPIMWPKKFGWNIWRLFTLLVISTFFHICKASTGMVSDTHTGNHLNESWVMKWQDLKWPEKHAFEWVWRREVWDVLTGYAFISLHPRKNQNASLFALPSCWCICCCCCSSFDNISLASITSQQWGP